MYGLPRLLRLHTPKIAVLLLLVPLYVVGQPPSLAASERSELANRFRFARTPLPEVSGQPFRSIREVAPGVKHISAWLSSLGAAVALSDLDGDGLPNDLCHVDPRTNSVLVAPVPGTPGRYEPFTLSPEPLPYDPVTMAPMGCLSGDFNEDGNTDVLVYYWGRTPVIFLHRGDGAQAQSRKSYLATELVSPVERWYSNTGCLADLDGDGHADLVIGNYHPDGGQLLDPRATTLPELNQSFSRAFNGGGPRLFLWKGATGGSEPAVRFEEFRGLFEPEVAGGWTLAVGAFDVDGDLLPELYIANDFGPDRLLHNLSRPGDLRFARLEGSNSFTTPNSKVLGRDSFKGMGVDFGDLNGDGLPDIFVSNITVKYAIQESNFAFVNTGELHRMRQGRAPYVDVSEPLGLARSGWAWDAKLADFDNDGSLEIVQATGFLKGTVKRWPEMGEVAMGNDTLLSDPRFWPPFPPGTSASGDTHPAFFVRAQNGRFHDLAPDVGLGDPQVSRGIAVADVDGDGRLDFALADQWERSYFFYNESPPEGSFLGLHVLLPVGSQPAAETRTRPGHPAGDLVGRPAIGAVATVYGSDGRVQVGQVDGGNGHSGKRSSDLHFGLGSLSAGDRVRVDLAWRDSDGQIRRETLDLAPGWHTVLLGHGGMWVHR
jgi:enediyne biosynthesis protein E4